mgnify:CR=1 FL=1
MDTSKPAGFWNHWLRHPQRLLLRKAVFQVHLYSALSVGLYVFFISVTGSVLVYRNELYELATPEPLGIDLVTAEGVDVEGYEYVAFLSVAALSLAITGPGEYSLDAVIEIGDQTLAALLDGWVGIGLAALGVVVAVVQLMVFWRPDPRQG